MKTGKMTIGGVPLEQFTIVADRVLGWNLSDKAKALAARMHTLTGVQPEIVDDEAEVVEHEIHIASPATLRKLPFDKKEAFCGLQEGTLYLYATTPAEMEALQEKVCTVCFSEDSTPEITECLPENPVFTYTEQILSVEPGEGTLAVALEEAADKMKEADAKHPVSVILELTDGEYVLDKTILLDIPKSAFAKLTVRGIKGAKPVIHGCTPLNLSRFKKIENEEYFLYQCEKDENGEYPIFHDLYDNGRRVPIATGNRYITKVNFDNADNRSDEANYKGIYVDRRAVEELDEIAFPTEFTIFVEWEYATLHAVGVDYNDTKVVDDVEVVRLKIAEEEMIDFAHGIHHFLSIANRVSYFGNNRSLLKPGTWAYDATVGKLYYYPQNGEMTAPAYAALPTLISLKGVMHAAFENLTFTGTGNVRLATQSYRSTLMNDEGNRGILPLAAIMLDDCANIEVKNCTFTELGTNGIRSQNALIGADISDCCFENIAMSAITIGHRTAKWQEDDCNYNLVIRNNVIHNIAMEFPGSPAVYISHVDQAQIIHNTICKTAYSAIALGWLVEWDWYKEGDFGKKVNARYVEIAYNRIIDYMLLLCDGAGVYVGGANYIKEYPEIFNTIHDNYAERTELKNNSDRGYYIDMCASNWEVRDCVAVNTYLPMWCQYQVVGDLVYNNRVDGIYATQKIKKENHSPERNTLYSNVYIEENGKEALLEKYPKAKAIYESSGAIGQFA